MKMNDARAEVIRNAWDETELCNDSREAKWVHEMANWPVDLSSRVTCKTLSSNF